jgi:hypothetical protein
MFTRDAFAMIRVGATDSRRIFGARHRVYSWPNGSDP